MGVQWTYLVTNGEGKEGQEVLRAQHIRLREVYQWRQNVEETGQYTGTDLENIDACTQRVTWNLFAMDNISSMSSGVDKPPVQPNLPWPTSDHRKQAYAHSLESLWQPYPEQRLVKLPFHPQCHYSCFLSLAQTSGKDEAQLPQGNDGLDEVKRSFYVRYEQLESWPHQLPECMTLETNATPHVLILQ